ncbi:putative damage-inducible protein DinB [Hydrogenophaga palleronii]|uniref:Damage-inducible protein DinB n=1 Tax=Hydrogenophaga palleronii TaxID=65655 RepID=A0ABU1WSX6_9BURK|nr:DinB family protein [Hydrogenophaga palleronii]MDR7152381.1 putative damage-inducible protein DinB [Hydrogenophaga palleronii]
MAELNPWQAHFTQLARYNVWATERLLQAIEPVSELDYRRDLRLFFKSIHGTLNHLLVGEHMLWQRRFARGESPMLALDMEAEPERDRLAQALKGGAKVWEALIAEWPAERFDGKLQYTTTRGQAMSLPFAATLAHVFNHGTHHRGQITAALTFLGQPAPVLDLVYFLQQNP